MNTFARYSAKTLAFSASVLAHLPSGFLIGGIAAVGLLNFFVAFHMEQLSGVSLVMYCWKEAFRDLFKAARSLWVSLFS